MRDFEKIMFQLGEMVEARKIASEAVKLIFQNKSFDLEQRWEIFKKAVEGKIFCESDSYTIDFKFCEKHGWTSWYNDFNLDRHQEQDLVELVDNIVEQWWGDMSMRFIEGKWVSVLTDAEFDEMIATDLEEVKEEIMQCGYSSFILDW